MKPITTTAPHVIIMVGIPGAGKTTFVNHFAKIFHAPVINQGDIAEEVGIDAASAGKVADYLLNELFKSNRTLIYEGPTHTKAARTALIKKVTNAGYKPLLLWVQTESLEAKRRATKRGSNMTAADFDHAISQFHPPTASEMPIVISGKHTYATQLKVVLKYLAAPRTAGTPPPPPQAPTTPARSGRNILIR